MDFPAGRMFAFTVLDDTDVATVANVRPIYDLLHDLGMRTTKTVWPLPWADPSSSFISSETLADPEYVAFVRELQQCGFEITWHGATMESSRREQTLEGLEQFARHFGHYPRIHVNHSMNRENLYWGVERVDMPALRSIMRRFGVKTPGYYLGHVEGSEFWWGDACRQHVQYCRNLTFAGINTEAINPTMPYRDPRRPLVPWWFSASDAEDMREFCHLLRPSNIARLEEERGFCIVATHFGKGFVRDGEVEPGVREALERIAQRPGWFPTVSELLDWLRTQHTRQTLAAREWRSMQLRWLADQLSRKFTASLRRRLPRLNRTYRDD